VREEKNTGLNDYWPIYRESIPEKNILVNREIEAYNAPEEYFMSSAPAEPGKEAL
jgi:hypothetical protein